MVFGHWVRTGASDAPLIRDGAPQAVVSTIVVNEGRELAVDLEVTARARQQGEVEPLPVRAAREVLGSVAGGAVRARRPGAGAW